MGSGYSCRLETRIVILHKLIKSLNNKVFKDGKVETCEPVAEDVKGFDEFMKDYNAGLEIERAAVENLK